MGFGKGDVLTFGKAKIERITWKGFPVLKIALKYLKKGHMLVKKGEVLTTQAPPRTHP